MEASYRRAIETTGAGSTARKRAIINAALGSEALYDDLMRKFHGKFRELVGQMQQAVEDAVEEHLDVIRVTLDMVRDENVALEGERDPELRGRVAAELGRVKERMERVREVVEGGSSH